VGSCFFPFLPASATPAQAHGFVAWHFPSNPDSGQPGSQPSRSGSSHEDAPECKLQSKVLGARQGTAQYNSEWRSSTTTTRKSPCVQRESLLENRGNRLHKAHLSAFVVLSRDSFAPIGHAKAFPASLPACPPTHGMARNGDVFRSGGTGHDASGVRATASSWSQSGGQDLLCPVLPCSGGHGGSGAESLLLDTFHGTHSSFRH
jgi:hypothetical protein